MFQTLIFSNYPPPLQRYLFTTQHPQKQILVKSLGVRSLKNKKMWGKEDFFEVQTCIYVIICYVWGYKNHRKNREVSSA